MAMRKFHWFENGKPVCNRKTSGYSAHSPGLANCLACRRVLRKRPTMRALDSLKDGGKKPEFVIFDDIHDAGK